MSQIFRWCVGLTGGALLLIGGGCGTKTSDAGDRISFTVGLSGYNLPRAKGENAVLACLNAGGVTARTGGSQKVTWGLGGTQTLKNIPLIMLGKPYLKEGVGLYDDPDEAARTADEFSPAARKLLGRGVIYDFRFRGLVSGGILGASQQELERFAHDPDRPPIQHLGLIRRCLTSVKAI